MAQQTYLRDTHLNQQHVYVEPDFISRGAGLVQNPCHRRRICIQAEYRGIIRNGQAPATRAGTNRCARPLRRRPRWTARPRPAFQRGCWFVLTCRNPPNPSCSDSVKKSSHTHYGTLNELNITPLLDLAFVDITKVGLATAW